tara:strand:+ start:547 stop:1029 length:483 start_codon:yes stop_codon:yes gene_type:complete
MTHHHKTETIIIDEESVEIDKQIVPIVSWLNSIDGIITLHSCEGFERTQKIKIDRINGIFGYSYIIFRYCSDKPISQEEKQHITAKVKAEIAQVFAEYIDQLDSCFTPPEIGNIYMGDPDKYTKDHGKQDPSAFAHELQFKSKDDMREFARWIVKKLKAA